MNKLGKFIVIEGLEGAGKTTAMQALLNTLKSNNIENIQQTREPGGTPIAEKLRAVVKEGVGEEPIIYLSSMVSLQVFKHWMILA